MDELISNEVDLFAAGEVRRRELAALPFPEKVRLLVRLQRMAAPILRARGVPAQPWDLGGESDPRSDCAEVS